MTTRREVLFSFLVLPLGGFLITKDNLFHEPSDAFRVIYNILKNDKDWANHAETEKIVSFMTPKAGFSIALNTMLLEFESLNSIKPKRIVDIRAEGDVEYTTQDGKVTTYDDLDSAIQGIYGIQRL